MLSADRVPFVVLQSKHAANTGGGLSPNMRLRQSAVHCWIRSGDPGAENIKLAVRLFNQANPGHHLTNVSHFIRTWAKRFQISGSVETPRSPGRPVKLPTSAVDKAVALLWAGYVAEGQHRFYTSITQAATHNRGLKAICAKYGISTATLLRLMKKRQPAVKRRRLVMKRQLTQQNNAARRAACRQLGKATCASPAAGPTSNGDWSLELVYTWLGIKKGLERVWGHILLFVAKCGLHGEFCSVNFR